MVMKCTVSAVCLVALALLSSFCEAQFWASDGGYQPPKPVFPNPVQPPNSDPVNPAQQERQTFEKPLTWTYPADPQPDPIVEVPFELRHPVPTTTVAVECRENDAHMEVKKDMFGKGQFINPNDLTLGNCGAVAEDTAAQVLIFETELQGCLSTLTMTEDALIYSFTLNYNPKPMGMGLVVRSSKAAVLVECHYPRKHNVSSLPLNPLWVPFSAVKVAEEFLYFTMRLMTDDWQYERPSYQYYLGDFINIEAAVKQYFHVPLCVYVDSCVATLTPDSSSNPRYAFIDNNGCFLDAKITGSDSMFMTRTLGNKLQFQLEAFKFQGADSGMLYITCHLKATSHAVAVDSEHRACSYVNGWKEASGADAACGSCESAGTGAGRGSSSGGGTGVGRGSSSGGGTGVGRGSSSGGGTGVGRGSSSGGGTGVGRGSSSGGGTGVGRGSSSGGGTGVGRGSSSGGGTGVGRGSSYGGGTVTSTWGSGGTTLPNPGRKTRDVSEVFEWEGDVTLGPIPIEERLAA